MFWNERASNTQFSEQIFISPIPVPHVHGVLQNLLLMKTSQFPTLHSVCKLMDRWMSSNWQPGQNVPECYQLLHQDFQQYFHLHPQFETLFDHLFHGRFVQAIELFYPGNTHKVEVAYRTTEKRQKHGGGNRTKHTRGDLYQGVPFLHIQDALTHRIVFPEYTTTIMEFVERV